jgi:hypothetical protein
MVGLACTMLSRNVIRYQCHTEQASPSISAADKNAAIAEAKFIRAVAYYHLAVYWGAVPIIEDNSKLIKDPLLNRNIVSDVYKFVAIRPDLRSAKSSQNR